MKQSPKMNINKRSNGSWILCPSKSIPGKFYYFNVLTGEAVWSLSETESKFVRKGNNIERVTDKMHNYPEPISPPKSTYTPNNYYPSNSFTNESHKLQTFGHAIFPKYISNVQPNFSNIIWTPIQMPMFVTNTPEVRKQTLDQITQTSEPERDLLVQTCSTSLSQRFGVFGNTNMSLNIDKNRDYNYVLDKPLHSSKPINNWWNCADKFSFNTGISKKTDEIVSELQNKRKLDKPSLILKESKLKRLKTLSETDYNHQIDGSSSKMDINYRNVGNTSLCKQNKVENLNTSAERNGSVEQLDKSDLRFLLRSKRGKSVDLGVLYSEKQKQENNNKIKNIPKKRVSFNLNNISDDDSLVGACENDDKEIVKTPVPIKSLKQLSQTSQIGMNKEWYISVDEDVLLDDYNFVTDYIEQDNSCKLLIPDSMLKYIESLGMGEHGGRSSVIVARQVYRRLVTAEHVEVFETENGTSLMDDVLKICLQVMDMDIHVVLITKYVKLEKIAKSYGIHVYTLDSIKNGVLSTKPKAFENNTKENLFLQNKDSFDPFILSKSVTSVHSFRKTIFNYNNDDEHNKNNNLNKEHNTGFNNLFYTDKNENNSNNYDTTSIDVNIEQLKINDDKLNNIKIVIKNSNFDNSKARDKIVINNSEKSKPFRSIFDHIDIEKSQFHKNNISNIKTRERNKIDTSDESKPFRSIFDHIEQNGQFNKKNTDIDNIDKKERENIITDNSDEPKPFRSIFDHIETQKVQSNKNNSASKRSKTISNDNELFGSVITKQDNDSIKPPKFQFESLRKPNEILSKDILQKTNIWDLNSIDMEIIINNTPDTVEGRLEKFYVKDEVAENNIIMRYDEWICCFVQIMEEFINIVLQKNANANNEVPHFFRDGLVVLKEIYFNTKAIKTIVEKLLALCRFCGAKGVIGKDINPDECMKILGCGLLLIEAFENLLPEDLSESKELLAKLLKDIENPKPFEGPLPVETPIRRSEEEICPIKPNFVKSRSDVVNYLKKHFVEWKNYDEFENEAKENQEINQNVKIFRTSGKNLNTFKIDSKKRITFEEPKDKNLDQKSKDITIIDKTQTNKHTDIDIPTLHGNTFNDTNNNGPKVIRNVKPIDAFEERVRINLDLDALDYSKETEISKNFNETQVNEETNDCPKFNDTGLTRSNDNDSLSLINDLRNDSGDSGFGNDGHACVIRNFLTDLSVSLKSTYMFIDKCVKDFRDDEMTDESKGVSLDKVNKIHTHVAEIIDNLKKIIERESSDSTLKSLLLKVGSDIAEDKRLTRYKQTVTKCLEQAQILHSSLRIMRSLTNEEEDVSVSSNNEIRHFNIFE